MTTPTPDPRSPAGFVPEGVDRLLDAVQLAIGTSRPLLTDWYVDAQDVLTELHEAIERAQHPDDRDRAVSVLSSFAGLWFTPDERDVIWLGGDGS
jgi:hypothetical protein